MNSFNCEEHQYSLRVQSKLEMAPETSPIGRIDCLDFSQVRMRITEILERLANVSGYRARLTSLRDQIYEGRETAFYTTSKKYPRGFAQHLGSRGVSLFIECMDN